MSYLRFTDLNELNAGFYIDLVYATKNNFTGAPVYPAGSQAFLRQPVAFALLAVQGELKKLGLGLKIWDAYRPFSVQEILWERVRDPRYVARPVRSESGLAEGSMHNRGCAVDLTLVNEKGEELEMPTPFDEFTERAHRSFMGASEQALRHRSWLERAMEAGGFVGLPTEWWHFDWKDWEAFDLCDLPIHETKDFASI